MHDQEHPEKQAVDNPTVPDIGRYQWLDAPDIASVYARATVHYVSDQYINYNALNQYYLANVPASKPLAT